MGTATNVGYNRGLSYVSGVYDLISEEMKGIDERYVQDPKDLLTLLRAAIALQENLVDQLVLQQGCWELKVIAHPSNLVKLRLKAFAPDEKIVLPL